jgi:hypothetical protein
MSCAVNVLGSAPRPPWRVLFHLCRTRASNDVLSTFLFTCLHDPERHVAQENVRAGPLEIAHKAVTFDDL